MIQICRDWQEEFLRWQWTQTSCLSHALLPQLANYKTLCRGIFFKKCVLDLWFTNVRGKICLQGYSMKCRHCRLCMTLVNPTCSSVKYSHKSSGSTAITLWVFLAYCSSHYCFPFLIPMHFSSSFSSFPSSFCLSTVWVYVNWKT